LPLVLQLQLKPLRRIEGKILAQREFESEAEARHKESIGGPACTGLIGLADVAVNLPYGPIQTI
jgi:hypothetical protein